MLYNDNPRTIKDLDENKKRLKAEAERETAAGKRKMQIEEQRRKQLKISDKKREIDELTRSLASKETFLRRAVSELDMLRSEKQREERKLKELEQKSTAQKPANDARLAEETAKLKNIDQETNFLKQDLYKEKKQAEQRLSMKESDRQNEKKKIYEEKRLQKDLGVLEREKNMRRSANSDVGIRSEKSALETIERRILAVGGDIQKVNLEIAGLKTDLQK